MAFVMPEHATLLTVSEVAEFMRISRMSVYRLIEKGEIPALRVGRSFRVPRAALEQIVADTLVDWEKSAASGS